MNSKFNISPEEWNKAKKQALKDIQQEQKSFKSKKKCKKKLKS